MEKLDPKTDGASKNIVEANIEKLKAIFPSVFTEGKIDFDSLKETLGDYTDDRPERYSFNWNGKARARLIAQTPSTGTLRPCPEESVNWDTTQNLFIEGDNLEVLKLLQKSYHKKVKVIYIDPPYNTGNEFIYPDKFAENLDTYLRYTGQIDDEGFKISANAETSGRFHTNWLNMIYPRLKLARNLLADDGVIAVSIDDNELFQLGNLMDDIFGETNRLACAPWLSEASGGKEKTGLRTGHEYLLIYVKETSVNITQEERSTGELNLRDDQGSYRKGRELMKWGGTSLRSDRPNQFYSLPAPDGTQVYPYRNDGKEGHWRWGKANENSVQAQSNPAVLHWEIRPFDSGVIVSGKAERWVPYEKIRDKKKSVGWSTWLDKYGTNADATRELKDLFGFKPFDTPKPATLIEWIINLHQDENALALDFFAGSASLAHAVLNLNQADGGSRRFVCVQLPEPLDSEISVDDARLRTVADIGKERIRRVIKNLSAVHSKTDETAQKTLIDCSEELPNGDLGFKVFKLDASNVIPWDADFDTLESSLFAGAIPLAE